VRGCLTLPAYALRAFTRRRASMPAIPENSSMAVAGSGTSAAFAWWMLKEP